MKLWLVFGSDSHACAAFKATNITSIKLTEEMLIALKKPPFARSDQDLRVLSHVVARIPVFHKYSANVQYELGRTLHIESFPSNRVVLQQG